MLDTWNPNIEKKRCRKNDVFCYVPLSILSHWKIIMQINIDGIVFILHMNIHNSYIYIQILYNILFENEMKYNEKANNAANIHSHPNNRNKERRREWWTQKKLFTAFSVCEYVWLNEPLNNTYLLSYSPHFFHRLSIHFYLFGVYMCFDSINDNETILSDNEICIYAKIALYRWLRFRLFFCLF